MQAAVLRLHHQNLELTREREKMQKALAGHDSSNNGSSGRALESKDSTGRSGTLEANGPLSQKRPRDDGERTSGAADGGSTHAKGDSKAGSGQNRTEQT